VNTLIFGLILALSVVSAAQTATKHLPQATSQAASKLLPLVEVIEVESDARTEWDLAAASDTGDHRPKSREEGVADINKFIAMRVTADNTRRGLVAEQALFKKHRDSLSKLVSVSPRPFLYGETPVRFASKDGALTLLLTTLVSQNVYNTLRLDAKQRAAKEIEDTVLPAMSVFSLVSSTADIKSFGVIVVYGTRDFSETDSILSRKGEVVALVASADRCRKLGQAELTEEEFVDSADVYLVDRDMIGGVRKVKVSLGEKAK